MKTTVATVYINVHEVDVTNISSTEESIINYEQDTQLGIESVGHIGKDSRDNRSKSKALRNCPALLHPKVLQASCPYA